MFLRFKHTRRGIRPEPKRSHVLYVGLLCDRELLGEVIDTFTDSEGLTRLKVRHFNGEPWPIEPWIGSVDVLDRDWKGNGNV